MYRVGVGEEIVETSGDQDFGFGHGPVMSKFHAHSMLDGLHDPETSLDAQLQSSARLVRHAKCDQRAPRGHPIGWVSGCRSRDRTHVHFGDGTRRLVGYARRQPTGAPNMDRVLIDDLRVLTVIGALAHEREAAQPLRVDLSIGLDLRDAGRSDELDDTVNYGLVAECIVDLANESKHVLLERLATDIADRVLGFDRVEEVDVTVTKLRPPVPTPVGTTAVRLVRTRGDVRLPPLRLHEAIVALGSNLGDREGFLRLAVRELGTITAMSQVFETEPIGGPDDQGAYLNMVVKVETSLDPFAFIRRCQRIEAGAQRQRVVYWGPRTLDVDLLFFDDIRIDSEDLTVPHPRINERRFVLTPLSEVAPGRCPDGWDDTLPPDVVVPRGPLIV